jgi:hypothetical protein
MACEAFFRLHVVNMVGDMDVEVGVITDGPIEGDDRPIKGARRDPRRG